MSKHWGVMMSTKDRREREKEQRRQTIIDAARDVIRIDGFDGVSMDKVAEKAELSKGALYLYFKNKDELLTEIFWAKAEEMIAKIENLIESNNDLPTTICKCVEYSFELYNEEEHFFRYLHQAMLGSCSDIFKKQTSTVMHFHVRLNELGTRMFTRFDKETLNCSPEQAHIALTGLVRSFLAHKFVGIYTGELNAKFLTGIFLKGVLK